MPTLTIDGRTITVPDGSTILQGARTLGIDIPTLCWYPTLPVVGNCRICLVSADGSGMRQITDGPNDDSEPRWSPDGRRVAYHSRQTGEWSVWMMAAR